MIDIGDNLTICLAAAITMKSADKIHFGNARPHKDEERTPLWFLVLNDKIQIKVN